MPPGVSEAERDEKQSNVITNIAVIIILLRYN